MQANLSHLLSSASDWALSWPEPVALLFLGAALFALSFQVRGQRRVGQIDPIKAVVAKSSPPSLGTATTLATNQAR